MTTEAEAMPSEAGLEDQSREAEAQLGSLNVEAWEVTLFPARPV